ncbi:hypothetical protein Hanom_Chr11g00980651 [Helianthus anomalus]
MKTRTRNPTPSETTAALPSLLFVSALSLISCVDVRVTGQGGVSGAPVFGRRRGEWTEERVLSRVEMREGRR